MDPEQVRYYTESIRLCDKLIRQLENDRDGMQRCVKGELLSEYRKSTEKAIRKVKQVRDALCAAQSAQQ